MACYGLLLQERGDLQDAEKHWPGDYFYGLGLGSQMASLKFNLAHALLRGHVYHFPTTHYANPVRCPSQTFDCYFAAPTNCSRGPSTAVSIYSRAFGQPPDHRRHHG